MLGLVGKLITTVVGPLLPSLGSLGKGKASAVGALGTAVSAVAGLGVSHVVTDQNVVALVHEAATVLIALFAMIGSFGVGRKAGAGA